MKQNRFPLYYQIFFVVGISIFVSSCTSFYYRVADNYYEEFAYARAIPKYEKVLRKEFNPVAASKLADAYRKNGNSLKAEIWYSRLVKSPMASNEDRLHYAEVLMENGKYSEASERFHEYLLANSFDKKARKLALACDSIHLFFEDTTIYTIQLLPFNGEQETNFSPSFYRDGIAFISDRPAPGKSKHRSPWTGREYLDIFYTSKQGGERWIEPQLLKGDINGLYDEGPAVFSADFKTIYFTRMNYLGKNIEKNQKDVSLLKLFTGSISGNLWKLNGPMIFNSNDYSVGHPALSPDGKTLYFVSDMPWGYGGTDIYKSLFRNGQWSDPVNLGPNINSEGNEMFPFIAADSVIYFASDGHFGLGGLDVYSSYWDGQNWSKAENLQYPINSSKDDFGFIIDSTNSAGYFSSNRARNQDMIYGFSKNPPIFSYKLTVVDNKSIKPVKTFSLFSFPVKGEKKLLADGINGVVEIPLKEYSDYRVQIKSHGYYADFTEFSTKGKRKSEVISDSLYLEKIELNKPVVWKDIHFPKKETEIITETAKALDSLSTILKMNPEIQIEIASHTDSRGSFAENINVSKRRAELITEYLVSKGISQSRLMGIGYGEGKLKNNCRDGILCLEEDHMVNNRVEIKVTSVSKQ